MTLCYQLNPPLFDDWKTLYDLIKRSFAYMEGRIDPPSSFVGMTPKNLKEKAKNEILIVVHDNHNLVACGFIRIIRDAVYIGKLAVDEAWQRHGISKNIMKMAAHYGFENSKEWLELQTRVELVDTFRAFSSMGFKTIGETAHAGYDRPTSMIMRCSIIELLAKTEK